ncbi:hypothetical protein N0V94_004026 [Neodidymelliopsis sp. IMI 364377]|nr:hypothetical protein N0V94_004026 [Neodidymelliopsis sp. IMI 364377]
MVFATSPAPSRFEPKHSRLPSNSVGRKVPRKSSTVSSPPIKKTPKARASTPRKPESAGTLKGTRPSTGLSNEKPRNDVSRFQKSKLVAGRSFKLEESIAQDIGKSYVPRRGTIKQESPESGSSSPLVAPPNKQTDPSIQTQTASQQQTCSSETCHRRRLRNDYMVPPELEGVERALGSENWIDYLMLAKKRVLNEITEAEYHAATRRLFYVINSKLRERIQAEVIKSMVELVTGGSIFSTECKCVQVEAMEETS